MSFMMCMVISYITWFGFGFIFSVMTHIIIKKKDFLVQDIQSCMWRSLIGYLAILDFLYDMNRIHNQNKKEWKFLSYPIYKVKR